MKPQDQKCEKLYLIGEKHSQSTEQRDLEKKALVSKFGNADYYREHYFPSGLKNKYDNPVMGDRAEYKLAHLCASNLAFAKKNRRKFEKQQTKAGKENLKELIARSEFILGRLELMTHKEKIENQSNDDLQLWQVEDTDAFEKIKSKLAPSISAQIDNLKNLYDQSNPDSDEVAEEVEILLEGINDLNNVILKSDLEPESVKAHMKLVNEKREYSMVQAINSMSANGVVGFWKVGETHLANIKDKYRDQLPESVELLSTDELESILAEHSEMMILQKEEQSVNKLYIIGENHQISSPIRSIEYDYLKAIYGNGEYITEKKMPSGINNKLGLPVMADPADLNIAFLANWTANNIQVQKNLLGSVQNQEEFNNIIYQLSGRAEYISKILKHSTLENNGNNKELLEKFGAWQVKDVDNFIKIKSEYSDKILKNVDELKDFTTHDTVDFQTLTRTMDELTGSMLGINSKIMGSEVTLENLKPEFDKINHLRDMHMLESAIRLSGNDKNIFWKVGQEHVDNIKKVVESSKLSLSSRNIELIDRDNFNLKVTDFKENRELAQKDTEKTPNLSKLETTPIRQQAKKTMDTIYLIGESHHISGQRRGLEKEFIKEKYGEGFYFTEPEMRTDQININGLPVMADVEGRSRFDLLYSIGKLMSISEELKANKIRPIDAAYVIYDYVYPYLGQLKESSRLSGYLGDLSDIPDPENKQFYKDNQVKDPSLFLEISKELNKNFPLLDKIYNIAAQDSDFFLTERINFLVDKLHALDQKIIGYEYPVDETHLKLDECNWMREDNMLKQAQKAFNNGERGVWKIGGGHVERILENPNSYLYNDQNYNIKVVTEEQFNEEFRQYFEEKRKNNERRELQVTPVKTLEQKTENTIPLTGSAHTDQVNSVTRPQVEASGLTATNPVTEPVVKLKSTAPPVVPVTLVNKNSTVQTEPVAAQVQKSKTKEVSTVQVEDKSKQLDKNKVEEIKKELTRTNQSDLKSKVLSTPNIAAVKSALKSASQASSNPNIAKQNEPIKKTSIEDRIRGIAKEAKSATVKQMPILKQKHSLCSEYVNNLNRGEQKELNSRISKHHNKVILGIEQGNKYNVIKRKKEQTVASKQILNYKDKLSDQLKVKQGNRLNLLEKAGQAINLRETELALEKIKLKAKFGISVENARKFKTISDSLPKEQVSKSKQIVVDKDIMDSAKNAMERGKKEAEKAKNKEMKENIKKMFKEADRDRFWGNTGANQTVEKMYTHIVTNKILGIGAKMDKELSKEVMKHMISSDEMNKFEQEYGSRVEQELDNAPRDIDNYFEERVRQMEENYETYMENVGKEIDQNLTERWENLNAFMDDRMMDRCHEINDFLKDYSDRETADLERRLNDLSSDGRTTDTTRQLLPL